MPLQTLHSILVKSILYQPLSSAIFFVLYIPFWLNLYLVSSFHTYCHNCLYIPFWLNLYLHLLPLRHTVWTSLHSILVKSILDHRLHTQSLHISLHSILVKSIRPRSAYRRRLKNLYIPFWLNLYAQGCIISI